jgi:hypothetical protein
VSHNNFLPLGVAWLALKTSSGPPTLARSIRSAALWRPFAGLGVAIFDALHRHGTVRGAILQAFDL